MAGLAAAPVVVVSVFRAVPREWPTTAVQLVSFTPWLVVPAGASLVFAVLGWRRWMAGAAAGLVAVQIFWLVPLDFARASPGPEAAAHTGGGVVDIRVMSLNAKLGTADAAEIVRLVRENGITALMLQEYTQALEDRLAVAGLSNALPNRISAPAGGAAGNAVYSVHDLTAEGTVPDSHFPMPMIRVTAGSAEQRAVVELTNVHTRAPVGVGLPKWRSDLAALGKLTSRPGNVVLAGDFNASYDHAEFHAAAGGPGRGGRGRGDSPGCPAGPHLADG
ncbi:endonuclease/exonuclease/phosphatase family protein [Pseudarthrobacter sp. So.54]